MAGEFARGWKNLPAWVIVEADVRRRPDGVVAVPYFTGSGELHNTHLFKDGRSWWEERGKPLMPFGLEQLYPEHVRPRRTLLVAEGESDALKLRSCFWSVEDDDRSDFDVLGLPGASSWRSEWAQHLEPYRRVYVIPDADEAGRRLASSVRRDIPRSRIVRLPKGEDARGVLETGGPYALDPYLTAADDEELLAAAWLMCPTLEQAHAYLRENRHAF